MEGKHIIQAVNFNNGEALDLQSLSKRLKTSIIENSELSHITGGCSYPCAAGGCPCAGTYTPSCGWPYTATWCGSERCGSDCSDCSHCGECSNSCGVRS